jgi:uncharacterized protein YcgI (DUF1989 family)
MDEDPISERNAVVAKHVFIPAKEARAFELEKGARLEVIASEGKQVGDLTAVSREDHTAGFTSQVTASANGRSLRRAEVLYAGPPSFLPLLRVLEDPVGTHWIHGRCTQLRSRLDGGDENAPNCHTNIVESLAALGVPEHLVPFGTFNIFMAADIDADGRYSYREPEVEKDQSILFQAEANVLVSISACPSDSVINAFEAKGLTVALHS